VTGRIGTGTPALQRRPILRYTRISNNLRRRLRVRQVAQKAVRQGVPAQTR
jgi:hypothetical protein